MVLKHNLIITIIFISNYFFYIIYTFMKYYNQIMLYYTLGN